MSEECNVVMENFGSYYELLKKLKTRPKNAHMKNSNSSKRKEGKGGSWYKTETYEDAEKLLTEGYTEVIQMLEKNIKNASKIQSKYAKDLEHPIPHNAVAGYIPNVPNALQNLPQSMISIDRKPMKRKTLSIMYVNAALGNVDGDVFVKAGAALMSAVDIIEKSGIQTEIDLAFKCSWSGNNEAVMASVRIKNYGERYSIKKIAFPIAHPSMMRRFGFRWYETSPDTAYGDNGYGRTIEDLSKIEELNMRKNKDQVLISLYWIKNNGYSVEKILKKMGVM